MLISKNIYSISIANLLKCAQNRIAKAYAILSIILHSVVYVKKVFAQFVSINFMKETAIKMV